MPKNVMKLVKPSPHRARNDFDLSHRHIMSANFGELIPSTCIETVPGDHIEMHASDLIRAIPMVTSPFMRAKQHIDVWFVPFKDLWHQFDSFIVKKSQPVSSALQDSSYLPYFNLYNLWNSCGTRSAAGDTDIIGRALKLGSDRLLNYLGYGYSTLGNGPTQVSCNPFRLAAYNYIWYNEYRQQYYDNGMNNVPSPNASYLFNFDDLQCNTLANAEISSSQRLAAMSQMRYRCWKKDLYTGLMPSTQFGSVSTIDGSISALNASTGNRFLTSDSLGNINLSAVVQSGDTYPPVMQSSLANLNSSLDVIALRRSEAIQIWRENALRAGNRVADNMMAHYGIASDFKDHRPSYLGSVSSPLNIGDVMATANSDYSGNTNPNTNVGDIAGKGLSSLDEKVFKFDSKDFGVIMAISSILPEAEYNAQGVSRPNQLLEAEDFFVPEYENLGLEAVSSQTFVNTATTAAKVVGYAPRYWSYKTKLDKCYDIFRTGGINAPWCSPKFDVSAALSSPPSSLPLATLYVNPKIFDVNFAVGVDVQPQFLCDYYFDVDAVRPMSVVGLPFS